MTTFPEEKKSTNRFGEARFMFMAACLVIIIAGLKAAATFIVPLLFAAFLAIISLPPIRKLEKLGLPNWLAMLMVIILSTLFVAVVAIIAGKSVAQFRDRLPFYSERLMALQESGLAWLQSHGIEINAQQLKQQLDVATLMDFATKTASGLLSVFSQLLLIILTMVFILLEANSFPSKLRRIMDKQDADLGAYSSATQRVQDYLFVKAAVSLITGVLAGIVTAACGVDFAILWALIAFLFNFVPNIGSIIAAFPPVILALLEFGVGRAVIVILAYVALNFGIGNLIEPRLMGRKLGLSTLVVFLSLLFWGWIWGPTGMLLSVPLTVIVKVALEHTTQFRSIAIMLGPAEKIES